MPYIQNPKQKRPPLDRKEHVWYEVSKGRWKCVLCGGVTANPPEHPAGPSWLPETFELLTDAERNLVPYPPSR